MLLVDVTKKIFNTTEVRRGVLISAKHLSWDAPQSGIVTAASEDKITVTFLPATQNIQNHYTILINDVEAGRWTIRYSNDDLQTIVAYEGGDGDGSEPVTVQETFTEHIH